MEKRWQGKGVKNDPLAGMETIFLMSQSKERLTEQTANEIRGSSHVKILGGEFPGRGNNALTVETRALKQTLLEE